ETELEPGDQWDQSGSDPVADIQKAGLAVFAGCQRMPNVLVLSPNVYEVLRNNPAVVDRVKYSELGVITPQLRARVFDVERVLWPRCHVNTTAPGQPAMASPLWKDNAYLLHVTQRPGLKQVTFANTFVWNGMPGSNNGVIVELWREHGRKADMIRVQKYYDCRMVATGAAHRLLSLVTS